MGQIQIHDTSLRRSELLTVIRQVALLNYVPGAKSAVADCCLVCNFWSCGRQIYINIRQLIRVSALWVIIFIIQCDMFIDGTSVI